jgi:hypothetical protein
MDRFLNVVVYGVEVMPVMNSLGNRDSGSKRQTYGKNSDRQCFLHNFPLNSIFPAPTDRDNFPRPSASRQKQNGARWLRWCWDIRVEF